MIDVIGITQNSRPALRTQAAQSLYANSDPHLDIHFTLVLDGFDLEAVQQIMPSPIVPYLIINRSPKGASRSRNMGASSIPKYRRQKYVMFMDDDIYLCPGWDRNLIQALEKYPGTIVSGSSHPYNHTVEDYGEVESTNVISTPHMIMTWGLWDSVGFFTEPGGVGGGEDVDYCRRATQKGYGLLVTKPQCVLHCGVTSSNGQPIVGADWVRERNQQLIEHYGLQGVITE